MTKFILLQCPKVKELVPPTYVQTLQNKLKNASYPSLQYTDFAIKPYFEQKHLFKAKTKRKPGFRLFSK